MAAPGSVWGCAVKGHITNYRNTLRKELERVLGGDKKAETKPAEVKPAETPVTTAPAPATVAAPTTTEPAATKPRRKTVRKGAVEGEVIDVEETTASRVFKAARTVRVPTMRVPAASMEWLAFLGFLLVFKISTDATHAAAGEIWTDGSVTWWHAAAAQAIISLIERFMFAGNINWFTITVLIGDALINAWGLVVDILPNFFRSGLWELLSGWNSGLSSFAYSQDTIAGLLIALGVGAFLAYAGDKLLDIAMQRR